MGVCSKRGLITSGKEICGLVRAYPSPLIVLLFLEFQSTGNEFPITVP